MVKGTYVKKLKEAWTNRPQIHSLQGFFAFELSSSFVVIVCFFWTSCSSYHLFSFMEWSFFMTLLGLIHYPFYRWDWSFFLETWKNFRSSPLKLLWFIHYWWDGRFEVSLSGWVILTSFINRVHSSTVRCPRNAPKTSENANYRNIENTENSYHHSYQRDLFS